MLTKEQNQRFTEVGPGTEMGELLHPERYPREKLEKDKIILGPHAYDTQFQQQPKARAGSFYFNDEHFLEKQADGSLLPWKAPPSCDAVFCVIDSASKAGKENDGTGVVYYGLQMHPKPRLYVLDWGYEQMQANLLIVWLPNALRRCEELARIHKARAGSQGAWIEDKDSGIVLLQQAQAKRLKVRPIPAELTSLGKDGRALNCSGYIYEGRCCVTEEAYAKTSVYKGHSKNHFFQQATEFRMSHGTASDDDEMFDCLTYGNALAFGDRKGMVV